MIVSAAADAVTAVVHQGQADAEDGDVDLLLDPLALPRRVRQVVAQWRVFGEQLKMIYIGEPNNLCYMSTAVR